MLEEIKFNVKSVKPTNRMLSEVLGESYKYWEAIQNFLEEEYGNVIEEWKYYGQKYGWSLKLLQKKRNLFFFIPHEKSFVIGFVFGDKAVSVIEKSKLPKKTIEEIKNAKKYMEGRGLRIEIKSQKEVEIIKILIKIKVDN
jgi:hypothetical protein